MRLEVIFYKRILQKSSKKKMFLKMLCWQGKQINNFLKNKKNCVAVFVR